MYVCTYTTQIDEVTFIRPMDVGDLIKFKSRVIYTSDDARLPVVQVEVTCQVVRPERLVVNWTNCVDYGLWHADVDFVLLFNGPTQLVFSILTLHSDVSTY